MGLIAIVLLVILVVSAILLVLVVLVQDEQGEGLGGIFGGGSTTPFGSRSGNVLTRFTAILATVFLVCTLGLAWVNRTPETGNVIGRARQESLNTAEKQTWWVQTPAVPGGASTPNSTAAPAPNTAPGGSSPSQQAPTAGSRQAPPPSNQEGN
jgi:preprotein translocase subunit SecG